MISKKNMVDYQYDLYRDYLDQVDGILKKYGQQSGLSIEYWHIRVDLSKNYDGLDSIRMQNSFKHYVYDLYHFVPTINMTPLTYQINQNPEKYGTSNIAAGSMTLFLIDKPLPGDLFRFYPHEGTTQNTELFRITDVRYLRTSKDKLNLYQVEFESAAMHVDTLEHVRINEIFCWDTENFKFLNEILCSHKATIIDCRDRIVDLINTWYDERNGWYGLCLTGGTEPPIQWDKLCGEDTPPGPEWPGQVEIDWPTWPPGPDWPIFPENYNPQPVAPEEQTIGFRDCGANKKIRPLVFLNTILKRLKKIFPDLALKPIYGIGTAKIPIEWILPTYEMPDPNNPDGPPLIGRRDYWDTFFCPSYQTSTQEGELFNLTEILAGKCQDCPPELVEELECHRYLYMLVMTLVKLLEPLLSEEQLKDKTCDRNCCDKYDVNFVMSCLTATKNPVFWDSSGPGAEGRPIVSCEKIDGFPCTPLYIAWNNGPDPVWP